MHAIYVYVHVFCSPIANILIPTALLGAVQLVLQFRNLLPFVTHHLGRTIGFQEMNQLAHPIGIRPSKLRETERAAAWAEGTCAFDHARALPLNPEGA